MSDLSETFLGYRFSGVVDRDEWATHDGPTQLSTDHDVLDFVAQNVTTHKELRIVDRWDFCVMHIVGQVLKFPGPGDLVWVPERRGFLPKSDLEISTKE